MKRAIKINIRSDGGIGDGIQDIIQAALDGNAKLVRDLLDAGADVNTVEPSRGFTCLHIACLNGDSDVVDVLLDHHQRFKNLDFSIKSNEPPRYAWQLAMSAHHYELANRVDAMGLGDAPKPTGPKLVK